MVNFIFFILNLTYLLFKGKFDKWYQILGRVTSAIEYDKLMTEVK